MELPGYLQPEYPSVFTLEITTRCQNNCVGCGNIFPHNQKELPVEFWEKVIKVLSPFAKGYRITGGEPTLHPDFDQIIRIIDAANVPWSLFSNANWIHPQKIIDQLKNCQNLSGLLISLHGKNQADYQTFCQVNAFERVAACIQQATGNGLPVTTNTLLLKTTIPHLEEIANFSLQMGTIGAVFGRYYGASRSELIPSAAELRQALATIANLKAKDPRITVSNCVPACFLPETDFGGRGCTSGITHGTIGPFGSLRPCTHVDLNLGHILEDDLLTMWQGPVIQDWRNAIPAECRPCPVLSRCRGGCRSTARDLSIERDPLMVGAVPKETLIPVIEIGLDDRPVLSCEMIQTNDQIKLIGKGRYVTLTRACEPILSDLNGAVSIQMLAERHGDEAIKLMGQLVHVDMVVLT